ncbi:GLPGLI family protein [Chryseobacterium gossypii]|uniref:GLPGLI family protein n=1 Tax=Chryseobacterium gossypii TaxID=3231602 RepID=UPI003524A8AC
MRKVNFYLFLLFLWSFTFFNGQNLHITYTYLTPLHARVQEDLYIKGNHALDIRDSVFVYEKAPKSNVSSENGGIAIRSKNRIYKEAYYKSASQPKILIKSNIADKPYWIEDTPPEIQWNTHYDETKIISNYTCKKATGNFRGSSIIAYYTTDLPYPYGPFKFGGLPGLILEIREENTDINQWVTLRIENGFDSKIEVQRPAHTENLISYKEFEALRQSGNRNDVKKLTSNLPEGTIVSEFRTVRKGIEKKYEWE